MKLTFQYYLPGSNIKDRAWMSDELYDLLMACVESTGATECHIVHVGTYGDAAHQARRSKHNLEPPKAIDIAKVYLTWVDESEFVLVPKTSITHRGLIADVVKTFGGMCYHVTDKKKAHVHVQI